MTQLLVQRPRAMLSPRIILDPTPPTVFGRRPQAHWHLIGDHYRPLHEQLVALGDAGNWATVIADDAAPRPATSLGGSQPSTGMTLTSVQRLDYAAVTVAGDLDASALHQLRVHVRALLDGGVQHLIIGLANVQTCDGRLGALLHRALLRLRARNGRLELVGTPAAMLPLMRASLLNETFATCDPAARTVDLVPAWATPTHGSDR
jgi:anti-anti-sigma factor